MFYEQSPHKHTSQSTTMSVQRERERERDVPPLSLSIVLIKNFITEGKVMANRRLYTIRIL